jgi:hypothetical protein
MRFLRVVFEAHSVGAANPTFQERGGATTELNPFVNNADVKAA